MRWTPFGEIEKPITITKTSIINFINQHEDATVEKLRDNFMKIIENKEGSEEEKQKVIDIIDKKIDRLAELELIEKEGDRIKKKYETNTPSKMFI